MKKYFIIEGDHYVGPFDLDELKNQEISATGLVWDEGIKQLHSARTIDELKAPLADELIAQYEIDVMMLLTSTNIEIYALFIIVISVLTISGIIIHLG